MLASPSVPPPALPATPLRHAPLTKSSARLKRRKFWSNAFAALCFSVTALAFVLLVWLLFGIVRDGWPTLSTKFITSPPSYRPARAGIYPALMGSLWLIGITIVISVPIGVGAAIYLQEYAPANAITRFVQLNIANLASVPSVVYGILALALFVRTFKLGASVLAGGMTLALLILPVIIIASQEALRGVPSSLRDGSYALGATRWQTIRRNVLPVALPGIMTGVILAVSRAVGEAAPLLIMGALAYIRMAPQNINSEFTALPIQIFNWAGAPQDEFKALAASGIIVLVVMLLLMNGIAIALRTKFNRKL
jgi:phosphate transport system permease protein